MLPLSVLPLNALRAVEAVGRLGSLAAAAADLTHVPVIRDEGRVVGWPDWFSETGVGVAPEMSGPSFSDPALAFEAALAGQGVMLAWLLVVSDALRDGRLVRAFGDAVAAPSPYWPVATEDGARKAKVRAFRAWLTQELASSERHDVSGPVCRP